jgi:glycosyltransferase involved in cell wall biosynthesis
MPFIQVFIATYNRPSLILKSITSALNQDFDSYEIIISDNSTNEYTESIVKKIHDNRLIYKRRKPSLPAIDHLNEILKEVTSDYFMIFHDDDMMYSNMLKELYKNITANKNVIAVGGNARIITPSIFPNKLMLNSRNKNLLICDRDQMAYQYLIKRGIVPFPSYLYRSEVAKKIRLDPDKGGKHCDVAFLMDITSIGNVLFLVKPLMKYFISSEQDSSNNNFLHKIKLVNFISKTTKYNFNSKLIKRYRILNLYYELIQDNKNNHQITFKRRTKILKLIFKISPLDFFPRAIFQIIK